ncbi:MAG: hypothetical protein AAFQ91_07595 [Cyanobacteria bacterium J06621_15]
MLNLKKISLIAIAFLTVASTFITTSVDARPPFIDDDVREEIRDEIRDRDRDDFRDRVRYKNRRVRRNWDKDDFRDRIEDLRD